MNDLIRRIEYKGKLLAIIIRNDYTKDGVEFFTPNDFSQQLAYMKHPKGKRIDAHTHNGVPREVSYTKEVLVIRKGKLRVDFYEDNQTTGEGGMVVMKDQKYYDKCRYLKNMSFPIDAPRVYEHNDIGFNYRMSNIHAAIGLAQVEKADEYKEMRIKNHNLYKEYLEDLN